MRFTTISALLSALSVTCSVAGRAILQQPLLTHAATNNNVSVQLFQELEELARIVDISYCVGLTSFGISKPFECLSRCSDFPKFELVTTWNTGVLLSDSCGYIALDHGEQRIMVAFRGTYSISNTVVDLSTIPQKYEPYPGSGDDDDLNESSNLKVRHSPKCDNCTVHMGFHSAWMHTRSAILTDLEQQILLYPKYQLTLVGHSLGGAVAALAGLEFQGRGWEPIVTTFGEPRVGNPSFVKYIDARFGLLNNTDLISEDDTRIKYRRVTHVNDPVPLLPLSEWSYAMHAGEIYISKSSLSPAVTDLQHCNGDNDADCIAGQDDTTPDTSNQKRKRSLLGEVKNEVADVMTEPWGIPSRYKLWQLFFAHRDYFWRIGLCVPGGDPMGGGGKYDSLPREEIRMRSEEKGGWLPS